MNNTRKRSATKVLEGVYLQVSRTCQEALPWCGNAPRETLSRGQESKLSEFFFFLKFLKQGLLVWNSVAFTLALPPVSFSQVLAKCLCLSLVAPQIITVSKSMFFWARSDTVGLREGRCEQITQRSLSFIFGGGAVTAAVFFHLRGLMYISHKTEKW